MKSATLILFACIVLSLNSCGQTIKKVSDPDKSKVKLAQDFASGFFTKLKNGEEYQFQDKATDAIKNQFTKETQKTVYQQLKTQLGDFQNLEFSESWIQNDSINIYRFKADFDKSPRKLEIRVVLSESGKIAGFWVKPWSDMLN